MINRSCTVSLIMTADHGMLIMTADHGMLIMTPDHDAQPRHSYRQS